MTGHILFTQKEATTSHCNKIMPLVTTSYSKVAHRKMIHRPRTWTKHEPSNENNEISPCKSECFDKKTNMIVPVSKTKCIRFFLLGSDTTRDQTMNNHKNNLNKK